MSVITTSVGQGGRNTRPDVLIVQDLLRSRGIAPGKSDGVCGVNTVAAIRKFQAGFMAQPDGLIQPGQATWQRLSDPTKKATVAPSSQSAWSGDSALWSQDKKLQSLKPELAVRVRLVLAALVVRGFQPKIYYGWRSVEVQARLYAQGKSKVRFSFHNAQKPDGTPISLAADIIDSRYAWTAQAETSGFWKALGEEAKRQGLIWGGDWVGFRDWAHVQLVPNGMLAKVKAESGL